MNRIRCTAIAAGLLFAAQVSVASGPDFPRLGGYLIGSPQAYEDPVYQARVAKLQFAVLNTWPSWRGWSGDGTTLQQAVSEIKNLNPNIKLFQYVIMDAVGEQMGTTGAFQDVYNKVSSMNWWVYKGGTSERVLSNWQSGGGGPFVAINLTNFATPDSNGDRWNQWFAKWAVQSYISKAPSLDGLYTDDVSWKPYTQSNGDWNLDGTTDDNSSATVQQWYRDGYQTYFTKLRTSMPNKLLLSNLSSWGDPNANLSGLSGQVNGGVIEGMIGPSWAVETWGGWSKMLSWYRKVMANIEDPKLALCHQMGSPTDYQAMRYGLASCLMDDGYYQFVSTASNPQGDYHQIIWFDEFDAKLGQAVQSPPTSAWQSGVYRRDFANGIALVNPKGNGTRTVTLEADFVRLKGTQAANINNGQSVRTITLQDRDGIILMRSQGSQGSQPPQSSQPPPDTSSSKKPSPPPAVSVQ